MTAARQIAAGVVAVAGLSVLVAAQSTRPAEARAAMQDPPSTRPTSGMTDDAAAERLDDLFAEDPLEGTREGGTALRAAPIEPTYDRTSGVGAVDPSAPSVRVMREGTFIVDRVGRVQPSKDGSLPAFVFESDGTSLQDPPVLLLPNLKLMAVEDAIDAAEGEALRFRITGELTEYRGRNYVLLQKVIVLQ